MQFFLITPLIIFVYCKNRKIGFILLWVLILGSCVTTFAIGFVHKFSAAMQFNVPQEGDQENLIYIKPWCRFGPYGIGGVLGLAYYEY